MANPKQYSLLLCSVILIAMTTAAVGVAAQEVDRRLFEAVKAQDRERVADLLSREVDVNASEPDGATALHWAAYRDDVAIAELLLDRGADANASNDYRLTPIALACDNAADEMVRTLLGAGAGPNIARSTGETPLMTCARTGNVRAVAALLSHGADPNDAESWHGQTALMWAAAERHVSVARLLIAGGADVRTRSKRGFTALLLAVRENVPELALLLLEAGADVNVVAQDGLTPLLVSTVRGHSTLATLLLRHGADPDPEGAGFTPLHWAAGSWHTELTGPGGIVTNADTSGEWWSMNSIRIGKRALVASLLAHGADADARLEKSPPQFGFASGRFRVSLLGATPFLLAAMDGNSDIMRLLVEAGADPTLATDEDTTPLMVAAGLGQVPAESKVASHESLAAVRIALAQGGDVNRTNGVGRTALHGAAHIRSDAIVQLLVDHGAELNVGDQRGITPLMIAEGGGHVLLPGLGGGTTAELLRALGGEDAPSTSFIDNFSQGAIR